VSRTRFPRLPSRLVPAPLIAVALAAAMTAPPASAQTVSASFTWSPQRPLSLWAVTFTSTSSTTGAGNGIASQSWDLDGNGTYEGPSGATAVRSFSRPGRYPVGLRVVDTGGRSSEATAIVRVGNRRPIASIARFPQQPHTGEAVTFFSTSVDQDGSIESQAWDLDSDGSFDDGKNTLASRTFTAAGVYTVRLRVTDDSGSSHEATQTFTVVDPVAGPLVLLQGGTRASLLSPFPIVRMSGTVGGRGTRVRILSVQAPPLARVQVSCKGRGCPFRRRGRTVSARKRTGSPLRFRQFRGRLLRPGARVSVFVTASGAIGKYTRFRVRGGRPPARADRCLAPGSRVPMRCPAG
jgi:PKD repeat protein